MSFAKQFILSLCSRNRQESCKATAKRPQPRVSAFALESLETRVMMSATPMEVVPAPAHLSAAVVTTNHGDYAPGETAVITTSNAAGGGLKFSAGELVRFQVTRTDGMADNPGASSSEAPAGNAPWYVIDGVGGFTAHQQFDAKGQAEWIAPDNDLTVNASISTAWFVENQYLGSSLLLTATGQDSGAVAATAFTDAAANTNISVTSSAPTTTYGGVTTLTAIVTDESGAAAPTGTVEFFDGATSLGIVNTADIYGGTTSTWSLAVANLNAGTHSISAVFVGTPEVFNDSTSGAITQTVNQLGITGSFTVANKTYDGSAAATVQSRTLAGVLAGDAGNVSLSGGTAAFTTAAAGNGKTVTLTGATLTGAAAGNYTLTSVGTTTADIAKADATVSVSGYSGSYDAAAHGATGTATGIGGVNLIASLNLGATFINVSGGTANWTFTDSTGNYNDQSGSVAISITARSLTGSFTVANKTYDGSAAATVQSRTLADVLAGDAGNVSLSGGTAAFTTAAAGNGKTVTLTGATLTGAAAGNYTLTSVGTTTADIAKADATVSVSGYSGSYDAAAHGATGTATGIGGVNLIASLNLGATFINVSGGTANWTFTDSTGNYNDQSGSVAISITARSLTGSFTVANKTYDGSAAATVQSRTLADVLAGDAGNVSLSGGTAAFTTAAAGNGKTVTLTGATLTGTAAGNYTLTSVGTTTADIAKADATVSVSGYSGSYDAAAHGATGTATGIGGVNLIASLNLGATFINVSGGTANWTFTDSTGNYNDQSGSVAISITARSLTGSFTVANKTYDGSAAATVQSRTLADVLAGDAGNVSLSGGTAAFTTAAAGNGKTVTLTGATLTGTAAGNYTLTSVGTTTADIAKADATVSVSGYSGSYDAAAHGATGTATGIGGVNLIASLNLGATFINVSGGTANWTFTDSTGNYNDQSGSVAISITARSLTGSFTVANKTYDGSAAATVQSRTLAGVLAGDAGNVSLSGGTAAFTTAAAGNGKTVTLTGATLTGTAAGNYTLTSVGTTTADIAKADATVSVSGYSGSYDAAAHGATGTATGIGGVNLIASLNLGATFINVSGGTANWTFTDSTGNYNDQSGSVAISITARSLTGSFTVANKTYDGSAAATVQSRTLAGVLAGDAGNVSLSGGTAAFTTAAAGNGKTVTLTGATLTGTAAGNYTLTSVGATTANIAALGITGSFTVANKTYDGSAVATVQSRTLAGVLAGDAGNVSLSGGTAAFTTAAAGNGKTVTLTGATLTGTAAGNYTLTSVGTTTANIAALGITGSFTVANKTYDGSSVATVQSRTLAGVLAGDAGNVSLSGGTAAFTTAAAGNGKTVTLTGATLTGTAAGNYTLTSVGTTTANIAKADAIINVSGYSGVYDGAAHAAVGTAVGLNSPPFPIQSYGTILDVSPDGVTNNSSVGLDGVNGFRYANTVFPADQEGQVTLTGAPAAGSGHFVFVFLRTQNPNTSSLNSYYIVYQEAGGTGTWLVGRVVNDNVQTRAVASGTLLASGDTIRASVVGNTVTAYSYHGGAWKAEVSYTMTGGDTVSGGGYIGLEVSGASPEVKLTNLIGGGYTGVFNAPAPGGTAMGIFAGNLSGLSLGGTTHTNAGTYADTWTFTDVTGNYNNASGSVTSSITKATATITVTGYTVTYDGAAHTATGTALGVGGVSLSGLNQSGTTHTNAGTYADTWTFTDVTGNYNNASGSVINSIAKATATINVTGYTVTYDGAAHTATGTALGVGGVSLSGLNLSGTSHTNAGTYSNSWTFTDSTGNYNNVSGIVISRIEKALATLVFGGETYLYDEEAVLGYKVTYNAAAHTATGTALGVLGESLNGLDLSGTAHTNAGTYSDSWIFTDATGNYWDTAGSISSSIFKATATVTVTGYTGVYDAAAHGATGTVVGVLGESLSGLNLSGTSHINAGTYSDSWTFTDSTGNYKNATGIVHSTIEKALATLVFGGETYLYDEEAVLGYKVTYDGVSHTATGTAVGVLGESLSGLHMTDTAHRNAGVYTDTWTFTDATGNYWNTAGSCSSSIYKATVTVKGFNGVYDGVAHGATVKGVLGETLSGLTTATHSNAGTYSDSWTYADSTGNYKNASGSVTNVIAQAKAIVTVTGYTATYNGVAHTATGTVTGVGGAVLSGLNLSSTTHTNAGTYTDSWTFTDSTGNYKTASGTVKSTIAKALATVTVTGYTATYNGVAHTATGTVTGVGGAVLSGLNLSSTTHTIVGTYTDTWTFTDVTGNYKNVSGIKSSRIYKATATVTVTGYTATYNGLAHTATGTVTGVLGESLSGLNLSNTTHTIVGTYTDTWTFTDVTGNYKDALGIVQNSIV